MKGGVDAKQKHYTAHAQQPKHSISKKRSMRKAWDSQQPNHSPPHGKAIQVGSQSDAKVQTTKKRGNEGSGAALMTCTCNVMKAETKHKQQAPT